LLVSPIVGFVCSALLLLLAKCLIRRPELYAPAKAGKSPPWWIRLLLIFTCTGVSFSHGSNDGQKGMGLMMLILIGILPVVYAVDLGTSAQALNNLVTAIQPVTEIINKYVKDRPATPDEAKDELSAFLKTTGHVSDKTFGAIAVEIQNLRFKLQGKSKLSEVPKEQRPDLRTAIYLIQASITKLGKQHLISDKQDAAALALFASGLKSVTDFIPAWVKIAVAFALGCGTMIGWKRIVVTVGEKIGKSHLTYAQGASAELIAMATIQVADTYGLPVSTTHVLSSGIAGTMAANRSGLQMATLRNILLAWVLTIPVCVLLGAGTFSGTVFIVFNVLGWK
jgi:inorganic phosphate transporter, PiT family